MSNFKTNLPVSQKLASLGVKAESEMYWQEFEGQVILRTAYRGNELPRSDRFPAYSLSELADVLREVGKIKGWREVEIEFSYLTVCERFFEEGESATNKYLEEIL